MNVYIVTVFNTEYVRAYTTERRAMAHMEELRRDGMSGQVQKVKLNEESDYDDPEEG